MSKNHDSAHLHVCGKSEFIDDRPCLSNELFADIFYSTKSHAKIINLDYSKAKELSGVIEIFSAKDFHHNLWGTIFQDQPILANNIVQFAGEPILIIVAESKEIAAKAKKKIEIEYAELDSILSIDEAKKKKSFIGDARFIKRGDAEKAIKSSPHQISNQVKICGQDHFYLESQASIAYPLEDGQLEVHSSSQHPTETQHVIAHALGLSEKDVVCIVKRMGGAFGGKESQAAPFAAMASLAAYKLNRPVRICLTKDDDMIMTGKRNPFQIEYTVGFNEQGEILGLKTQLYSDAGAYADLSTSIMERAMLHSDNSYYISNIEINGQVCKTHHHPHTAFRGFGGPKGVAAIERIIEEVASFLNIDAFEVRKRNLYSDQNGKNLTPYNQIVKNNCLKKLFNQLAHSCDYQKRKSEIIKFNKNHEQFVKGISMTSVKFGISFTTRFLNQANSLVIIHQDGSVQISTGATEMGQGVNARISELVSSELGIPISLARVMATRTDKNANTSPTAASSGTDLNGAAALIATRKIKKRLSELAIQLLKIDKENWACKTAGLGTADEIELSEQSRETNDPNFEANWKTGKTQYFDVVFEDQEVYLKSQPNNKISFKDLILEAYLNRISLSDYAHYKIPGIEFNKLTGKGDAFLYFTQGTACSEVLINKDTGEVKVLRTDILMDLGRPINKGLDIGQVAGAFIQGMGWVTTEKLSYNNDGLLISHAPSTYKIPSIQDVPRVFNIDLLENDENYANVRGSKAVGEPPLLLGLSVWCAINQALLSLKKEAIQIPATSETILRSLFPKDFLELDNL